MNYNFGEQPNDLPSFVPIFLEHPVLRFLSYNSIRVRVWSKSQTYTRCSLLYIID